MNRIERFRTIPLTVRVPLMVTVLMIIISAVISERVLYRLSQTQETYLQGLTSAYLDGLTASITPSVLREDSWEIYDTVERMKPSTNSIQPVETVVVGKGLEILASSDPKSRQILTPLDQIFIDKFRSSRVTIDELSGDSYVSRDIVYQDQLIGKIYAVFDVSSLLLERRQVFSTLLMTNALITILLGFIGFAAVRRMIRPMQVLETHMLDAASGTSTLIENNEFSNSNRETLRLYKAYNTLVNSDMERQALSRKLHEEEKLASLGRLASGMAHEINNPLGGLMNAADTLRKHGQKREVRETSIDLIQRGLQGIREVVQAALATYRPERLARPLSAQDFVDLQLLLRPELKRRRQTLDCELRAMSDGAYNLPAGPIRQAILNLLLNASSATPIGGHVGLSIHSTENSLSMNVLDQGSGLPKTSIMLLTTQDKSDLPKEGDGLGLWIVRQIVDQFGGKIAVSQDESSGAKISLIFPIRRSEVKYAA